MKKMRNRVLKGLVSAVISAVLLFAGMVPAFAATDLLRPSSTPKYEVTFLAGSRGTLEDGSKKISTEVAANAIRPSDPDVSPDDGYVFLGWDKTYEGHTAVTGNETYVAQYAVLVDGVEYGVQYVDEAGRELLSPKYRVGENGSTVTETSKIIEGYTVQDDQLSIVLQKGSTNMIQFVYTANPVPTPTPAPESSTPSSSSTTEGGTGTTPEANTPGTVEPSSSEGTPESESSASSDASSETIDDSSTPLVGPDESSEASSGTEEISDDSTPLVGPDGSPSSFPTGWVVGGAIALVVIVVILLLVLAKKRQKSV